MSYFRDHIVEAYEAVESELQYQEHLPPGRTDGQPRTCGEYVLMLRALSRKAEQAWYENAGNGCALEQVRKIAAVAVRCMAEHGAIPRQPVADPAVEKAEPGYDWGPDLTGDVFMVEIEDEENPGCVLPDLAVRIGYPTAAHISLGPLRAGTRFRTRQLAEVVRASWDDVQFNTPVVTEHRFDPPAAG
jgi:hypothetical protein